MAKSLIYTNSNGMPSSMIGEFAKKIRHGEESKWNYIWVYPINLAASLIGIALAPIAFLIDIIAAVIFKIMACFADSDDQKKVLNGACYGIGVIGLLQVTIAPIILFIRIFYPGAGFHHQEPSP